MTPPTAGFLAALCGLFALPAAAAAVWNPAKVPRLDWPSAKGWPAAGAFPRKSVALADLDGDRRPEILFVGTTDKSPTALLLFALHGNGKPLAGWPRPTGMHYPSGPVVGDVDGDGKAEVVVTDGRSVAVWDARGRPRYRAPAPIPGAVAHLHATSEAALADLDGDGVLELVFAVWGSQVAAVRLVGQPEPLPGFPLALKGPFGASPAVADLDGDGREDVVIPGESGACHFIRWRPGGVEVTGARDAAGAALAISSRSSAAIADLEGAGALSVVLGSYEGLLVALGADGVERWRFQVIPTGRGLSENIHSSPALVDLDGDGRREVLFAAYDQRVRALSSRGELLPGWERVMLDNGRGGVVAGDVDGDGKVEALVPDAEGNVFVFRADGAALGYLAGPSWNPILADVDGDARLELVLPIGRTGVDVRELPGGSAGPAPWPMHRVDARRSGAQVGGGAPRALRPTAPGDAR